MHVLGFNDDFMAIAAPEKMSDKRFLIWLLIWTQEKRTLTA